MYGSPSVLWGVQGGKWGATLLQPHALVNSVEPKVSCYNLYLLYLTQTIFLAKRWWGSEDMGDGSIGWRRNELNSLLLNGKGMIEIAHLANDLTCCRKSY